MTEALPDAAPGVAARRVASTWDAMRTEHNLARVYERRAQRRKFLVLGAGGTVVVAAAAALLLFFSQSVAPAPQAVGPVPVQAPAARSPKTTFADGSVARVSDDGELKVVVATPEHIEAVLAAGAADFEVTKHAERSFVVVAGPVRVRVVGTRFRVERAGDRSLVSVSEGKVEVQEGEARSYLEAGESRYFPSVPEVAKADPAPASSGGARARFLELARGGEFKAAYQVMSQSPAAVGSSAEDLFLAADAARISNHPEQAVGYLKRLTTEHRADSRAPLSAFTLGRLLLSQLSRPAEAAEAFALARRLRPSGSLAEDALAREAEARAAAGSAGPARSLAQQYVNRYPRGKHLPTMQRLAAAP